MEELFNDVRYRIDQEGLDYCFLHYSNWYEINDSEFHQLRRDYIAAADAIEKYVAERSKSEDWDD